MIIFKTIYLEHNYSFNWWDHDVPKFYRVTKRLSWLFSKNQIQFAFDIGNWSWILLLHKFLKRYFEIEKQMSPPIRVRKCMYIYIILMVIRGTIGPRFFWHRLPLGTIKIFILGLFYFFEIFQFLRNFT